MNEFIPKSKPLWLILIVSFIALISTLSLVIYLISVFTFTKSTNNLIEIQTEAINEQIVYNFEVYSNSIINTSNQIQKELANINLNTEFYNLEFVKYITYIVSYDPQYQEIDIYSLNGEILSSSNFTTKNNVITESWFQQAIKDQTTHYFSEPKFINDQYKIIISKVMPTNKYLDYVVLKMEIDFSNMVEIVNKSNLGNHGHISIVNDHYEYIYTSNKVLEQNKELDLLNDTIIGKKKVKIEDQEMMFIFSTITNTPWRIALFINVNSSSVVINNYIVNIMIFGIIFIIFSSLLFFTVSKGLTNPLNSLSEAMSNIEENKELTINKINISFPREAEILNYNFNVMMNEIKLLMKRVVLEQTNQRKSELKALQNQINPHFLYNTLDSIVYMVETNQNDDAVSMLLALSKLFKISISGGRNIITIKDEIEHARSYLFIQKIRYKDKFKYNINIENDEILEEKTMKLILQPLIENALYHGINKVTDNGIIDINVKLDNNLIVFLSN